MWASLGCISMDIFGTILWPSHWIPPAVTTEISQRSHTQSHVWLWILDPTYPTISNPSCKIFQMPSHFVVTLVRPSGLQWTRAGCCCLPGGCPVKAPVWNKSWSVWVGHCVPCPVIVQQMAPYGPIWTLLFLQNYANIYNAGYMYVCVYIYIYIYVCVIYDHLFIYIQFKYIYIGISNYIFFSICISGYQWNLEFYIVQGKQRQMGSRASPWSQAGTSFTTQNHVRPSHHCYL